MKELKKPLIVLAVTVPESIGFFKGQITYLRNNGFEVAVVSSHGEAELEGASFYPIDMKREISPLNDLISLFRLVRLFRKLKPQIVNTGTPKAGLLVGIASLLNRVPNRIYTCHGLRLETVRGAKRILLTLTERISAFCAKKVICVSDSLRRKLIELNLVASNKTLVIHHGSCKGVNVESYSYSQDVQTTLINKLRLPRGKVLGFVGRFTRDKGICELIDAFDKIYRKFPVVYLLLCGDYETGDPVPEATKIRMDTDPRIIQAGFVNDIIPYYYCMDILCLPTYREGFGNVILEANAASKPVIATRVTGCIDAVVDGVTGLLVSPGNSNELADRIEYLLNHPSIAEEMGREGRKRVERDFRPEDIHEEYLKLYKTMI